MGGYYVVNHQEEFTMTMTRLPEVLRCNDNLVFLTSSIGTTNCRNFSVIARFSIPQMSPIVGTKPLSLLRFLAAKLRVCYILLFVLASTTVIAATTIGTGVTQQHHPVSSCIGLWQSHHSGHTRWRLTRCWW